MRAAANREEFINNIFKSHYQETSIKMGYAASYRHEENGKTERYRSC